MRRDLPIVLIGIIISFISLELLCQLGFRVKTGKWLFREKPFYGDKLFQKNPWLIGSLKPGARLRKRDITISHNSLGFRGKEFSLEKEKGRIRIICYGGSSTYGVGLSDDETWPVHLGGFLGRGYQVINGGVPGYTTAEAVIQTALQQFDLRPDICIYYEGWNDIRNVHVQDLKGDYSDFHAYSQFYNLGLNRLRVGNRCAMWKSCLFAYGRGAVIS